MRLSKAQTLVPFAWRCEEIVGGGDWIYSDKPHTGYEPIYDAAAIERLEASNAALMSERANLIETKRQQLAAKDAAIERLVAEVATLKIESSRHAYEADKAREDRDNAERRGKARARCYQHPRPPSSR